MVRYAWLIACAKNLHEELEHGLHFVAWQACAESHTLH
jgi:hypothetical protein